MNYAIFDEHSYLEKMEKCKATLEAQIKEQQMILDGIDFGDGWSVAGVCLRIPANTNLGLSFQEYLKSSYKVECLKRAKRIAETEDLIEHIVFSGGYSGGQKVKVFCDHDSQYVAVTV